MSNKPSIEKMALAVIEFIALNNEDLQECPIYRIAHTANNSECRANHPEWTKELEEAYQMLVDQGHIHE